VKLTVTVDCGFSSGSAGSRVPMGARLSYPEVDLSDKVAIVTGGNTGIGYETGKALAAMGAHTIIACRSEERGQSDRYGYVLIVHPRFM